MTLDEIRATAGEFMGTDEKDRDDAFWGRVGTFIDQAATIGKLLYAGEDREYVQTHLSFWARAMYSATRQDQFRVLDDYEPDHPDAIKPTRSIDVTSRVVVEIWPGGIIKLRSWMSVVCLSKNELPDLMRGLRALISE